MRRPYLPGLGDGDADVTSFSMGPLWRRKHRIRIWRFVFSFGPWVRNAEGGQS